MAFHQKSKQSYEIGIFYLLA